ncbi:MAG TPA: 50S ribosomal protein L13 [Cyclobacteriaceae bacterium]|nr:50S ribosomal protein L13 [Cyclobacteriaceae bacterium]
MDQYSYKTIYANKATAEKNWVLVDAKDQVIGRLASQVASVLRGKNKTNYTPNTDMGDHVVIINAEKVKMTGKKWNNRRIFTYSGYPGGQRQLSPKEISEKNPARLVELSVRGMLPKNSMGRQLFRSLHVYAGTEHPHTANQPKEIKF